MKKSEAIKEAIEIVCPDYISIILRYKRNQEKYTGKSIKLTPETFLQLISQESYNLRQLGLGSATIPKMLKELLPTRISRGNNTKPCTDILREVGYKYCQHCKEAHPLELFRSNQAHSQGYNTFCIPCQNRTTALTQAYRQSNYRASKLQRTPSWQQTEEIKAFYNACPAGMHVDHIIPLQGEKVSGLHVLENLQYLSAVENVQKRNKFEI